jgi:hypothetical protein
MSETASGTGQKSQESGIQSVPGTQGTTQAHTPAPWQTGWAAPEGTYKHWMVLEGGAVTIDSENRIANVSLRPEAEANARLIAAAPDLLEQLIIAHERFICGDVEHCPEGCNVSAAIAKALGTGR